MAVVARAAATRPQLRASWDGEEMRMVGREEEKVIRLSVCDGKC